MAKKSFSFNTNSTQTQQNQKAVQTILKRPEEYPTRTQTADPLPGQTSIYDHLTAPDNITPVYRRKSAEKRTVKKQLTFSPETYRKASNAAFDMDISVNAYLNAVLSAEIAARLLPADLYQANQNLKAKQLPRTRRVIALFTPSLFEEADKTAAAAGISFNSYVVMVIENGAEYQL